MWKRLVLLCCAPLMITSCALLDQIEREWIEQNCNSNGAFNAGLRDGMQAGIDPRINFAANCPVNKDELNHLYLKGFAKGLKARPTEIKVDTYQHSSHHRQ